MKYRVYLEPDEDGSL